MLKMFVYLLNVANWSFFNNILCFIIIFFFALANAYDPLVRDQHLGLDPPVEIH